MGQQNVQAEEVYWQHVTAHPHFKKERDKVASVFGFAPVSLGVKYKARVFFKSIVKQGPSSKNDLQYTIKGQSL